MPCGCKIPVDKYPETADWGPLFWTLLHGLAELSGKQSSPILQSDEIRTWTKLIIDLQPTIPCDICHDHYGRWLAQHHPSALKTLSYEKLKEWIRNYWWSLHNEINEGNEKPVFPFESLSETYKGVNITEIWQKLQPVMKRAITLNGISLFPWSKWLAQVRTLQGIYGIL